MTYQVSIIQPNTYWEDVDKNLSDLEAKISRLPKTTNSVLLPEMFSTGFTMNSARFAETMQGKTIGWMNKIASYSGFAIGGSLIVKDGSNTFNRFVWVEPNGKTSYYDKRHLFVFERESGAFNAGNRRVVIQHGNLRILLAICYDLRFPVWLRNQNDYDAIFLIANWPSPRHEVWQKLLFARAIENQCYIAAVNRVGNDGNKLQYLGQSIVIDPKGKIIHKASDVSEEIFTVQFDLEELSRFREKFPVWMDADRFELDSN
jgi:omega-amidase